MPDPGKPTAHMYSADIKRENAYAPLIDACFYCGKKFGESAPRRGVRAKNGATLMAHAGCADRYETDGPPARPEPDEPPPSFSGKNIHFPSVEEFQSFIQQRGPIPSTVRITVGDQVINEGENHEHQRTEVSFAHRDVQQATDAEVEKLTELVIEEQRYHYQHGEVVELVVETDNLGRNVRYRTMVTVEHGETVDQQTAEFDEDDDRLRKMTG